MDKYIYYIYIYNACSSHVGSTDDALLLGSSKRPAGRSSMADGDACDVWGYGLLGGDRCGSCASARPFSATFRHLSCH